MFNLTQAYKFLSNTKFKDKIKLGEGETDQAQVLTRKLETTLSKVFCSIQKLPRVEDTEQR